jgi:hypothetical protein
LPAAAGAANGESQKIASGMTARRKISSIREVSLRETDYAIRIPQQCLSPLMTGTYNVCFSKSGGLISGSTNKEGL